jgi:hypothetical protein
LPRLVLNRDSPALHLPSSWDYRREPPRPANSAVCNLLQWEQDPRTRKSPKRTALPAQLAGQAPHLTGGAVVDLGVRPSPQELYRDPPELGDHCNGSERRERRASPPWPLPSPPPSHPLPALSTLGRKARCSLCSSDRSRSILAARPTPPGSADPALAHFRRPRPGGKRFRRGAAVAHTLGSAARRCQGRGGGTGCDAAEVSRPLIILQTSVNGGWGQSPSRGVG